MVLLKSNMPITKALEQLGRSQHLNAFRAHDIFEVETVLRADPRWLERIKIDPKVINAIRQAATIPTAIPTPAPLVTAGPVPMLLPRNDSNGQTQSETTSSCGAQGTSTVSTRSPPAMAASSKVVSSACSALSASPEIPQPGISQPIPKTIPTSDEEIRFYDLNQPYGQFSNFFSAPFELDGRLWLTSEHYFQASKFYTNAKIVNEIRTLTRPRDVFDRAHFYHGKERQDWADVKEEMMKIALLAKFMTHNTLRKLLNETGSKRLVEHTSKDNYWADGGDGSGKNRLGVLLMEVREELRDEKKYPWRTEPPPRLCMNCQIATATASHPCCSLQCAQQFRQNPKCRYPGCGRPPYWGSEYCSRTCRDMHSGPTLSTCISTSSTNSSSCGGPANNGQSGSPTNSKRMHDNNAATLALCAKCGQKPVHLNSLHCSISCKNSACGPSTKPEGSSSTASEISGAMTSPPLSGEATDTNGSKGRTKKNAGSCEENQPTETATDQLHNAKEGSSKNEPLVNGRSDVGSSASAANADVRIDIPSPTHYIKKGTASSSGKNGRSRAEEDGPNPKSAHHRKTSAAQLTPAETPVEKSFVLVQPEKNGDDPMDVDQEPCSLAQPEQFGCQPHQVVVTRRSGTAHGQSCQGAEWF